MLCNSSFSTVGWVTGRAYRLKKNLAPAMHKGFYFGHQWVPGLSWSDFLKNRLVKQKLKVAVYELQWYVISLLGNADVEDKMNSNMFVHWAVTDWHRSFNIQFRMMTVSEQQSTSCNMLLRWTLIHYVLPLEVNVIKCIKSGISALKDFLYIFLMWPRSFRRINSRTVECINELISVFLSVLTAIFSGEPGLAGFIGAKDDGSGVDNCS